MIEKLIQQSQKNEITIKAGCKGGVYVIKNLINNKVYVGSAINFKNRWYKHNNDFKNNKNSIHLQNAWGKYGRDNFVFEIVRFVKNMSILTDIEQVYLDLYESYKRENGYNIRRVAKNNFNCKHSEYTKNKISETTKKMLTLNPPTGLCGIKNPMYGRHHTEKTRQKISNKSARQKPWRRGGHLSKEHKEKLRAANVGKNNPSYGKSPSIECRQKISKTLSGRVLSEEHKRHTSEGSIGKTLSTETKRKLSKINEGVKNPMFGKHLSPEMKKKMSEKLKGRKPSEEEILRQKESHRGQIPWCTGKKLTGEHINHIKITTRLLAMKKIIVEWS
jgi:group I intron endonuclease